MKERETEGKKKTGNLASRTIISANADEIQQC